MKDNIIEILTQDYQRFPVDQTYSIYAEGVFFKDPLNEFYGVDRFKSMIGFMQKYFRQLHMDLHEIYQKEDTIYTRWTLNWITPLPWQPAIAIPGRSELKINEEQLIVAHIDYWDISPWQVLQQHFTTK